MTVRRYFMRGILRHNQSGFTLIELVVALSIAGILAAAAIPQYTKVVEQLKANDALTTLQRLVAANKMFRVDHPSKGYVRGPVRDKAICPPGLSCPVTFPCGLDKCNACYLIACGYIAKEKFDDKAYEFFVGDGSDIMCTEAPNSAVACAMRKDDTSPGGTDRKPYRSWAYAILPDNTVLRYSNKKGDMPP